jgi:predicted transcriptional regulator
MPQYSVTFDDGFDQALSEAAARQRTTKADIIRKAVASYIYLNKETASDDRKVSITNDQDRVIKDVVLPK